MNKDSMNGARRKRWLSIVLTGLFLGMSFITTPLAHASNNQDLEFNPNGYVKKVKELQGKEISYRAFENITYVKHPTSSTQQRLSVYVPEAYYEGKSINGYTATTAPIFFPNSVGGYMPGDLKEPDENSRGGSTILKALAHGYVVVSPEVRGRTSQDDSGKYVGKAPAVIIDLKAAVRYLHYNNNRMPGDADKIVSNGTSAGGAVSALLGATGDNKEYEPYLKALGAARDSDSIWAVSAYCPITNLEEANGAYEWSYGSIKEYTPTHFGNQLPQAELGNGHKENLPFNSEDTKEENLPKGEGNMNPQGKSLPKEAPVAFTAEEKQMSKELEAQFIDYVNKLQLKDPFGQPLSLKSDGTGSFMTYTKSFIIRAANEALKEGKDLKEDTFLVYDPSHRYVIDINWDEYNAFVGRIKGIGAFDSLKADTGENDEFGTKSNEPRHFTKYMAQKDPSHGMAEEKIIKLLNPMHFIQDPRTKVANYWRIRYGEKDSNTSIAIPVILATLLQNEGKQVDFATPWNLEHRGDYDLEELWQWIDGLAKK